MDLEDAKTNSRGDKRPQVGDLCQVYKFPEKKWVTIRLMSGIAAEAGYWVKTKKKDGGKTKFYTPCPSYDPATQERDSTKFDPWAKLAAKQQEMLKAGEITREDVLVQYGLSFWGRAIIRSEQKKLPERMPRPSRTEAKSGFKEKDSDSVTPVMAIKMGMSFISKVKELKGLNTIESSKTGSVMAFALNDPKYGRDIRVYYDSSKAPADQYQIQSGDKRTPLTEEELGYLNQDVETAVIQEFDDAAVKADFESWASRNGVKLTPAKGKKPPVEEDEDPDGDEDDFDDEDEPKKPAKKAPVKGKKKPADDEDDFDDEDEFDEEESDDDVDDFDDEPKKPAKKAPAKGKAAPKGKKPPADEDDFDDEDSDSEDSGEDEDDFDDEPAPKSKKPPVKKAHAKGKKPPVEEEDEDDFDEDDEDEDEPKEPAKKVAAKAAPKGKKKPADDEDDFDEF